MTSTYLIGAGLVFLLMTALWLWSIQKKDASIIDPFWSIGFLVISTYWFLSFSATTRSILLIVGLAIWGLRLAIHLWIRAFGHGEDHRYQAMREKAGDSFWWKSLFIVFWLQAGILVILAIPLYYAFQSSSPIELLDYVGFVIFGIGLLVEVVADAQLSAFKNSRKDDSEVLNSGLWRYSRHPNYFGECLLWWGIFLVCLSAGAPIWTIFSPVGLTFLLLKVSGVTLLEDSLVDKKPKYREYIQNTSAFIPWFPKNSTTHSRGNS